MHCSISDYLSVWMCVYRFVFHYAFFTLRVHHHQAFTLQHGIVHTRVARLALFVKTSFIFVREINYVHHCDSYVGRLLRRKQDTLRTETVGMN